jgi:hypothetical protein
MIPQSFDEAFERVKHLVAIFKKNEKQYLTPAYSEAQARLDFIDKFWVALGWDVNHETQTNPYEQEVHVERGVKMSAGRKRADYAFLAPNFRDVLFYVEAKKPQADVDTPDYYFQTIRYGWNSQNPLAVLMDFEHLRVLDCRYKPDIETAIHRAVKKFHYSEYADEEKFREIYYLFSREAATSGSIEKFAATLPKPSGKSHQRTLFGGGYQSVDDLFLQELDGYREELARSFKNKNPHLNSEELTEVTQRTLDRLVFMRFLEDKLIEPEPLVENLGVRGSVWQDFVSTSHRLDAIYNGIIFKKHTLLDAPDFHVDERTFAGIRESLAHTNSPYDFNAIPIHILGSIYERFLGKVIVATDKRARVEEKPEVRKAGGVYYTPQYIVTYIVENTVGQLLEGKTPEQISKLRFADIACGSGSFLLGVYDLLLRHHTAYYNEPKNRAKALKAGCVEREDSALHLGLRQKKDILLNNIYGVDLDAQAVEVAQLSLFLKLLEDETTASAKGHQLEFRETMLPSLDKNVIHGNSLVDWGILDGQLFGGDEERNLFPMDFEQAFPEVMRHGGFDAVVGNPPYGMVEDQRTKNYLLKNYETVEGRFDTYELFIERGTKLCKGDGLLGYIVPSPLLTNLYTRKLRRYILDKFSLIELTNFGMDVFSVPTVHTCIVIVENRMPDKQRVSIRRQVLTVDGLNDEFDYTVPQVSLGINQNATFDIFIDPITSKLISKMERGSTPLGEICFIRQCIKTGDDSSYVTTSDNQPSPEWKPTLRGKSINRYMTVETNLWLKYGIWLARNWQNKSFYEVPKIAVRETGNRIIATLDLEHRYFLSSLYAIYPKDKKNRLHLSYLLALINSRLATYFLKKVALELTKGAFTKFRTNQLARLPIRLINLSDKADRAKHDRIVSLVEQMVNTKSQLQTSRTDRDQNYYESKCAALDRQIDGLVYELYGLTDEEIAIIEAD